MRRFVLLLLGVLVGAIAGCGGLASRGDEVRLWTGWEAEVPALQEAVDEFTRTTGVKVQLLKVPFNQLRNKFLIAAPASLGPDLLIGPHDWVGVLTTADLLEPLPEESRPRPEPEGDFMKVAVGAVTFQGKVYAAPLFTECVALFRNPGLLPETPASLPDLVARAVEIQRRGGGIRGFYYDIEDLYHSWPFFSAHGAYVFGERDGVTDPFDLGLATPGAVQAANFLRSLREEHGLIAPGATGDIAKSLFLEGKAAMIVSGPWLLADLRRKGVAFAIDRFPPTAEGGVPRPFVGVQCVMLNRRASRRADALRLLGHLTSEEVLVRLSQVSGKPPARRGALERAAQGHPEMAAFARVTEDGTPMPSHPAMGAVWGPMKSALELITNGRATGGTQSQLQETTGLIQQKIRLMME